MRSFATRSLLPAALLLAGLGGCKEFFADPPPVCPEDRHVSANHCCAAGEEWVPARNACVCLDPARCAGAPVAKAVPGDAGPVRDHPCVGEWKGTLKTSEGHRGPLVVTITAVEPGTVEQPYGKSCGTITERWGGDGTCRMRLTRCAVNGPLLIAAGAAGESSACEGPISVALSCDGDKADFKHGEPDMAVRGTLERAPAAK